MIISYADTVIDMDLMQDLLEDDIKVRNMSLKFTDIFVRPAVNLSVVTRILMIAVCALSLCGEHLLDSFSNKKDEEVFAKLAEQLAKAPAVTTAKR